MKKSTKPKASISAAAAASIANTANSKRGADFEKQNDLRLFRSGIPCDKRRIMTKDGVQISDHSYESENFSMWAESTLSLDMKKAKEFVSRRYAVLQVNPNIKEWVIYYKSNDNKKSRKSVNNVIKHLEQHGWTVFVGDEAIDLHISVCKTRADVNNKIPVAKAIDIALDKFKKNPYNRKINRTQVMKIAKSIVRNGFTSNLSVIPYYEDGVHTGEYILFDGHHRLEAIKFLIREMNYPKTYFESLPCVVVDWVTSKDKKDLHRILTTINWTTTKWSLRDYISSYKQFYKEMMGICKLQKDQKAFNYYKGKYESYKFLDETYRLSRNAGLPEGKIIYRIGPFDSRTETFSFDLQTIKNGDYFVTKKEREKIHQFIVSFVIPFEQWCRDASSVTIYVDDVSKMFSRKLLTDYKLDVLTLEQCVGYGDAFKSLGKNVPVKKIDAVADSFWEQLDEIVLIAA